MRAPMETLRRMQWVRMRFIWVGVALARRRSDFLWVSSEDKEDPHGEKGQGDDEDDPVNNAGYKGVLLVLGQWILTCLAMNIPTENRRGQSFQR